MSQTKSEARVSALMDGEKVRPSVQYQIDSTTGTFQLIGTKKEEMAEKVWQHTSDGDLLAQLDMVDSRIKKEPNNRDLWRERRMVVGNLRNIAAADKLKLTEEILLMDAKNKYAWSHRQWIFITCGGGDNESVFREELRKDVEFCDGVLKDDVCNDFAWDQRLFSVRRIGGDTVSEVDESVKFILRNPDNEYPWIYLKGIYCKGIEAGGQLFKDKVVVKLDDFFKEFFSTTIPKSSSHCGKTEPQVGIRYEVCVYKMKYVYAFVKFLDLVCLGYKPSWSVIEAMEGVRQSTQLGYTGHPMLLQLHEIAFPIIEYMCPMRIKEWTYRMEYARNSAGDLEYGYL